MCIRDSRRIGRGVAGVIGAVLKYVELQLIPVAGDGPIGMDIHRGGIVPGGKIIKRHMIEGGAGAGFCPCQRRRHPAVVTGCIPYHIDVRRHGTGVQNITAGTGVKAGVPDEIGNTVPVSYTHLPHR